MNILKKIVAVGTILGMIAGVSPVFAVTAEELLAQIQQLQAQLNQLMSQYQQLTGQTAGVPSACAGITFTRDLAQGMSGNDVKCLQALLGVTPQTGYFGPLTLEAVKKFQEKYASEILAPLGLTAGTGYVGAKTRAKLNELLTPAVTPSPSPSPSPTPTPTPAVEGALSAALYPTPANVTVYPGDQNKAVAAFKLTALGSPIKVERVDLVLSVSSSAKPYKCLNYISLFDGENAIKGTPITKDTVLDTGTGSYYVRLTGVDYTVPEGASAGKVLTVKVSAVPVYPSDCAGAEVTLNIPATGIRGTDGAGLQQYAGGITRTFTLSSTPTSGNLVSSLASDNPKEGVAIISATAPTTEVELLRFNVKWENLGGTVDTVVITLATDASNLNNVQAVNLYDESGNLLSTQSASTSVTFSNLGLKLAKDTAKKLIVKAAVENDFTEGHYLKATVDSVSGEDDNEVAKSDTTDRAGNKIYIYTKAPIITLDSSLTQAVARDDNATGGAETGEFTITFKVTAKGGDIWISNAATSTSSVTNGYITIVADKAGTNVTSSSIILTSSATAKDSTWGYKVAENTTETFTAKITYTNSTSAAYVRGKIIGIAWNTSPTSTGATTWSDSWAIGTLLTNYVYLTAN